MRILANRLPPAVRQTIRQTITHSWSTPHCLSQMAHKGISEDDVAYCIANGSLIEVHNDRGPLRALLRDALGICVVVAIRDRCLVTAYRNNPDDHHTTLRPSAYYWGTVTPSILTTLLHESIIVI